MQSHKSNALFHPSLPRFYALREGFFWNAPQLHEEVHCHGQAVTICPATTLVLSHTLNKANAEESPFRLIAD